MDVILVITWVCLGFAALYGVVTYIKYKLESTTNQSQTPEQQNPRFGNVSEPNVKLGTSSTKSDSGSTTKTANTGSTMQSYNIQATTVNAQLASLAYKAPSSTKTKNTTTAKKEEAAKEKAESRTMNSSAKVEKDPSNEDPVASKNQSSFSNSNQQSNPTDADVCPDDPDAMFDLALEVKDEDPARAKELFAQAAELGNSNAMVGLAFEVKDEDPARAKELYEQAAELGEPYAMVFLAIMVKDEDPARAKELYEQAAELGEPYAMVFLAIMVKDEDPARAKELYEQAAELGNSNAMYNLARMVEDEDPSRAKKLYEQSAELGNTSAKKILALMKKGKYPAREKGHDRYEDRDEYRRSLTLTAVWCCAIFITIGAIINQSGAFLIVAILSFIGAIIGEIIVSHT